MTHHDITYVRHPESFSRKFRLLYGAIVPPALKRSRRVITVSEFSRQEMSQHFGISPAKISVVHNAVNRAFTPGTGVRGGRPFILAVSSPNQHKNFGRLIEAFMLSGLQEGFDLKVVGKQNGSFSRSNLHADGHPSVTFLGRVDDNRLIDLYRRASVFAFPSIYEGFGIPVLEAQACGTAVAASQTASLPEVLRDSAEFFDPLSVVDMARVLRKVATDSDLNDRLVRLGEVNVRRFSWKSSAEAVSDILDLAERDRRSNGKRTKTA